MRLRRHKEQTVDGRDRRGRSVGTDAFTRAFPHMTRRMKAQAEPLDKTNNSWNQRLCEGR